METLPSHVESTVQAVAAFHAEHRRAASRLERAVLRTTMTISAPMFLGAVAAFLAVWILVNVAGSALTGARPFDPPPFAWLQGLVSTSALFVTLIILAAQAREDILAEQRAQLTLHLAMISEQKLAKLISLIEELRHDIPHVADRIDPDAIAMGRPADPHAVMEAIRESTEIAD